MPSLPQHVCFIARVAQLARQRRRRIPFRVPGHPHHPDRRRRVPRHQHPARRSARRILRVPPTESASPKPRSSPSPASPAPHAHPTPAHPPAADSVTTNKTFGCPSPITPTPFRSRCSLESLRAQTLDRPHVAQAARSRAKPRLIALYPGARGPCPVGVTPPSLQNPRRPLPRGTPNPFRGEPTRSLSEGRCRTTPRDTIRYPGLLSDEPSV